MSGKKGNAERYLTARGLVATGSGRRDEDSVAGIHLSWRPKDVVEFPGGAYVQIANHGWRYGLAGDDLKPARRGFVAVRHALPVPELYVASDVLGALSPFNVMAGVVNVVASVGLGGGEGESSSAIRSLSRRCSPLDVPDGLRFHVWCDKERMPEGQALLTPDVLALIGEVSTSCDVELNDGWLIAYNAFGDVSTQDEETWTWVLSVASRLGDLLTLWGDGRDFSTAWPWYDAERVERPRKLDGSLRFLKRRRG